METIRTGFYVIIDGPDERTLRANGQQELRFTVFRIDRLIQRQSSGNVGNNGGTDDTETSRKIVVKTQLLRKNNMSCSGVVFERGIIDESRRLFCRVDYHADDTAVKGILEVYSVEVGLY
jgi:hypothetical protein